MNNDRILYEALEFIIPKTKEEADAKSMFIPNLWTLYFPLYLNLKEEFENKEAKGLSKLFIITKAMSKEEFKEEEHPRASDGKFTDKPGGEAKAPPKPKGTWGGKRPSAGRMPKQANLAVEKMRQRYQQELPNASAREIDAKIIQYARDNYKPDWEEFIADPVSWQKKEEARRTAAAASRKGRAKFASGEVTGHMYSFDTAGVRQSTAESMAKFKQEMVKQDTLSQAYKTFTDKEADKVDRNHAALVLAFGGIATAAGLLAIFKGRPSFTTTNLHAAANKFEKVAFKSAGKEREAAVRVMGEGGKVDPLEITDPTVFLFKKIVEPPPQGYRPGVDFDKMKEIYEAGWLSRTLGRMFKGEGQAMTLGPKWHGFTTDRFNLNKYYIVGNKNFMREPVFLKARPGDIDLHTGLDLWDARFDRPHWINILRSTKNKQTGRSLLYNASNDPYTPRNSGIKWFSKEKKWEIVDEHQASNWLGKNGYIHKGKDPIPKSKATEALKRPVQSGKMPKHVCREWTKEERALFDKEAANYVGWKEFLGDDKHGFLPGISRRIFAGLSLTTGISVPAAFYFHSDIVGLGQKAREERLKEEQAISRASEVNAIAERNIKDEIELEKRRAKAEELKAKTLERKMDLERMRENTFNNLINYGLRREKEGAVTGFSLATDTLTKEAWAKGLRDFGYSYHSKEDLERLRKDMEDKENEEKIDDMLRRIQELNKKRSEGETTENKGFTPDSEENKGELNIDPVAADNGELDLESVKDAVAYEIIRQIEDISQSCKMMIENGVPGHTQYEELNDLIMALYGYFRDIAKTPEKKESETVKKSIDKGRDSNVMTSQADRSGAAFVPEQISSKRDCPICNKLVSEEEIVDCANSDCPFSILDLVKE